MATSTDSQSALAASRGTPSRIGLDTHGIESRGVENWNLTPAELVEIAVARGEGQLVQGGAFNAITTPHTGRSPNDRFIVREAETEEAVAWGKANVPCTPEQYDRLREDLVGALSEQELFIRDMWVGADEAHRMSVRVVTPSAWHNLFAYNMFRSPAADEAETMEPQFTILHDPEFRADPEVHGTNSETFIVLHLSRREVLIGGTRYAGEIKKSAFSMMNFLLPERGVLPMHCSANVGEEGDVAVFFGLSGTGKTTLSADPYRGLIGDDEHGWSADGVFNFEGGCYAKAIGLTEEREPEIFATTQRFGTVLENLVVRDDRTIDLDSKEITENTRVSYPLSYIPNFVPDGKGGHPRNIVFLTADAYGVLPPIARLTSEQAEFHFLSGYTAKLAGTERGVTEPKATFSACFGAPFLPRSAIEYAEMLGERIQQHGANVWLVNTGWTGGAYGEGKRMDLAHTRAMVRAALAGQLDDVEFEQEEAFGLHVPTSVPGVPAEVLKPRQTWPDGAAYDAQAAKLAGMFRDNFAQFEGQVRDEVKQAGPK